RAQPHGFAGGRRWFTDRRKAPGVAGAYPHRDAGHGHGSATPPIVAKAPISPSRTDPDHRRGTRGVAECFAWLDRDAAGHEREDCSAGKANGSTESATRVLIVTDLHGGK